jgi:integrating conjugative element protein (TIGR03761 family)
MWMMNANSSAGLLRHEAVEPSVARLASTMPASVPGPMTAVEGERLAFLTEANSPFADGYSLKAEREALADLLETDSPDDADPRYPRLLLLEEREQQLRQAEATHKLRMGAEAVVTMQEALSMRHLGSLVDEEADSMTLHTKEGYRLFMGRARDPQGSFAAIVGGKRIASALKALWMLTGVDNPYADWALARHEQNLALMTDRLGRETRSGMDALDAMKRKGLSYALLVSSVPKQLSLGFKSPYGYAIAELVVTYDYFIRVMKTLERKNLRSDEQVRQTVREMTRFIRRHFNETARFERWLLRAELKELSRADFLPGAAAEAAKRVEAATAIFGPVPADVFAGRVAPRHTRRRQQLSAQERKLLQDVSEALAAADATASAEAADEDAEHAAAGLL